MSLERSDETAEFTRVHEEITQDGQLEEWTWPAGTKLQGEKTLRFGTLEGCEFFLASKPPEATLVAKPVTVRGRIVEPSPHNARPRGEYLYLYDIELR